MNAKKSFILYTDSRPQWEKLTDQQAGKLIKAVFCYADEGSEPNLEALEDMLFSVIKAQLDRDATKWALERQARSIAGKKGAAAKWSHSE